MRLILFIGLTVVMTVNGTAQIIQRDTLRTILQSDSGRVVRVDVDNLLGAVEVIGTDRSDVRLTAVRILRLRTSAKRSTAESEVKLLTRSIEGRIVVYVDAPWRVRYGLMDRRMSRFGFDVIYDLRLEVPISVDVAVRTRDEGDIHVAGIGGEIAVENVNGDVRVEGLAKSAYLASVNGDLTASFSATPDDACSFRTVNGSIDATFPESLEATLAVSSMRGDVYTDFPFTPIPRKPATLEEGEGMKRVRVSPFARVAVGSDGPELEFQTFHGTIRILKRPS
jgi:hypothetical protein